jgi:hypothetical protein
MFKAAYKFNSPLTDLITAVFGNSVTPQDAPTYVATNIGTWWIEMDCNGDLYLCTWCTLFTTNEIDLTDAQGQNPYTIQPSEFVGGRPPVIHKP